MLIITLVFRKNGKNQDGSGTNVLGRANAWSENAGGLTPLLDKEGKPIVTKREGYQK